MLDQLPMDLLIKILTTVDTPEFILSRVSKSCAKALTGIYIHNLDWLLCEDYTIYSADLLPIMYKTMIDINKKYKLNLLYIQICLAFVRYGNLKYLKRIIRDKLVILNDDNCQSIIHCAITYEHVHILTWLYTQRDIRAFMIYCHPTELMYDKLNVFQWICKYNIYRNYDSLIDEAIVAGDIMFVKEYYLNNECLLEHLIDMIDYKRYELLEWSLINATIVYEWANIRVILNTDDTLNASLLYKYAIMANDVNVLNILYNKQIHFNHHQQLPNQECLEWFMDHNLMTIDEYNDIFNTADMCINKIDIIYNNPALYTTFDCPTICTQNIVDIQKIVTIWPEYVEQFIHELLNLDISIISWLYHNGHKDTIINNINSGTSYSVLCWLIKNNYYINSNMFTWFIDNEDYRLLKLLYYKHVKVPSHLVNKVQRIIYYQR